MKKILAILLLSSIVISVPAQVGEFQNMLQQANQFYADNQYSSAIELYEKVLESNYESARLYFNLGNAYFKQGDIPSAILNYEKALKLDPTDKDARFNLNLANSRIVDKIEPLPEFFMKTWWRNAMDAFSSDQWAKAGLAALIMLLVFAYVFFAVNSLLARKIAFWTGMIMGVVMLFSFLFSASGYRNYQRKDSAIVFTPTVTVKSSPNDNSVDLFVIHEGTKLYLLDHIEGWSEIRLSNGNVGWVKSSIYKTI